MNTNGLMYQVSFDGGEWSAPRAFVNLPPDATRTSIAEMVKGWNGAPYGGQWRYRIIDTEPVIEGVEQPYKPVRRRVYV